MLNRVTVPLVSVLTLTAGWAIAQPATEVTQPATPPPVTTVLPADVGGVLLIHTSATAWNGFKRFIDLPPEFSGPGFLPYIPSSVNYATDIQPWLGEWTAIALMPPPENAPSASLNASAITIAPIADPSGIDRFVAQLRTTQGEPIERQFQGVTLLEWPAKNIATDPVPPSLPSEKGTRSPLKFHNPLPSTLTKALPFLAQTRPILPPPTTPDSAPAPPEFPTPESTEQPGLAIAILPGYVAAASSSAPIESWIASKDSSQNLASDRRFQRTLAHPEFSNALTIGYGNLTEFANLAATTEFPPLPVPLPTADPNALDRALTNLTTAYDAIDLLVWLDKDGIQSQSRIFYRTPQSENVTPPNAIQMAGRLPAATYISWVSRNFNQKWQAIAPGWDAQPSTAGGLTNLRDFTREFLGLDLEADIIRWIDGEFAAFIFPTNGGLFPTIDPTIKLGIGAMFQTSDRPAAERFFTELEEFIVSFSQGEIEIVGDKVGKTPVTSWEVENPDGIKQSLFAYAWDADNTLIFTTGIEPLEELYPQPYQTLDNAFTFQTAMATLPSPNDGYFYINMGSLLALINNFLPPGINNSPEGQMVANILGTVRSISLAAVSTPTEEQSDFRLVLSPRR